MKLVDRYLFRELLPPFLAGILVFTFLLLMSQVLRLMELIVNKGVGAGATLQLILFLLPSILVLTVPMSVFLSCVVTFGRLSAENELTALKTSGYSLLRLTAPVALFAGCAWVLTSWLIISALPAGNQAFRTRMFEIVRTRASVGLTEKIFNDDFEGLVIYVNRIPQDGSPVMEGIFISDARPEKRQPPGEPITIVAARGRLIADPGSDRVVFRLEDGGIHVLSRDLETYQRTLFATHDLQLSFGEEGGESLTVPKGLREMTLPELRAKVEEYRRLGVQQWAPLVEIHKKFAIPFAALIFGFLGVAMGVLFRRGEKLVSFALSVGIAIVYYVFLLAGEPLGKQGRLHPFWAMWAANLFFTAATALLFRKVLAETPFTLSRPRRAGARP
ncbi:MAG TPA: LPS export ABC transporter permease LptF [Candidatus Methanoperedens sp.]|nr:LPS export ABC transporter permease LptF [Candidatus Methanoperedens sp.]